jgi:hypothetical protein
VPARKKGGDVSGARSIPLMQGPWLALAESDARAFLDRLNSVLVRSYGPAAFTQHLPITGLRVMPISFYPGWLLAEGEAQLSPDEIGTFNVLYGPGFMWVVNGEAEVIYGLNMGGIPELPAVETKTTNGEANAQSSLRFLPSPLVELDTTVTGPDYLRFFCSCVWGDDGPFWLVETPDAPILQGANLPDDSWRAQIKPITMTKVDDHLVGNAIVCYVGSLFASTFKIENGVVSMEEDDLLTMNVIPTEKYHSPFRNIRRVNKSVETAGAT